MKIFIIVIISWLTLTTLQVVAAETVPTIGDIPRAEQPRQLPAIPSAEITKKVKPAYQATDESTNIKVLVEAYNFNGNQSFTHEQLSALLSDYIDREIGIKDLNEVTKLITEFYRKKGFFLAQAYLPTQDIAKNSVDIAIIEGQLGTLNITGKERLHERFLREMADYNLKPNDTVSEKNLVRNVTVLNALPGINATAQLNPSDSVGYTDVEIALEPLPVLQGYIGTNTYGNRFTGREVVMAGMNWNNPIGLGDQLSLNLKRSNDNGQRGLNLGYITPVHESGTLLGFGYNYIDYKLGGAFENLDAFGESQYFNVTLDQPILRDAQKGLTVRFSPSYKLVNDEVSIASLENRRNIIALEIGLLGDWLNAAGNVSNQIGFNVRSGRVNFKDDFAQSLDEIGAKTQGGFVKYNISASRTQYFDNGVTLALLADFQRASKNLDSVEKVSIGGINRWRQYAELPSLADTGFMFGAEISKQLQANPTLAKLFFIDMRPYSFVDFGRGKLNQKALNADNHVKSIHAGLGLNATFKNDWVFNVSGSHQKREFSGASAESELRFWGQLLKYF
jgi:hemolysin activation/secretion protein